MVDEEIKLKKQLGGSDEVSERMVKRINSAPIRNWMWLPKRAIATADGAGLAVKSI